MPAGIYIHIPFCLSKCPYCDFYSVVGDEIIIDRFNDALLDEIQLTARTKWKNRVYTSIYFGGGTPPLLSAEKIGSIIHSLRQTFNITPNAEISLEANPESITSVFLKNIKNQGVNRISIGVQSFDDNLLKLLGRVHNSETAEKAINSAFKAGFENIGIDLIFGIPGQTVSLWQDTLHRAIKKKPVHISAYGLTIESGTPFEEMINKGELVPVDSDTQAEMYNTLHQTLTDKGYVRYEISSYAKPGFECRHNLKYWTDQKYLGLGPSAHSYYTKYRKSSYKNLDKYIASINNGKPPIAFKEMLTPEQKSQERLMLGLRTTLGVELMAVKDAIDINMMATFIRDGYLKKEVDRIALTDKGFLFADEIIVKLLRG